MAHTLAYSRIGIHIPDRNSFLRIPMNKRKSIRESGGSRGRFVRRSFLALHFIATFHPSVIFIFAFVTGDLFAASQSGRQVFFFAGASYKSHFYR